MDLSDDDGLEIVAASSRPGPLWAARVQQRHSRFFVARGVQQATTSAAQAVVSVAAVETAPEAAPLAGAPAGGVGRELAPAPQASATRKYRRVYSVCFPHTQEAGRKRPADFSREQFSMLLESFFFWFSCSFDT